MSDLRKQVSAQAPSESWLPLPPQPGLEQVYSWFNKADVVGLRILSSPFKERIPVHSTLEECVLSLTDRLDTDAGLPGPSGIYILEMDVANLKVRGLSLCKAICESNSEASDTYCVTKLDEKGQLTHDEFHLPNCCFKLLEFTEPQLYKDFMDDSDEPRDKRIKLNRVPEWNQWFKPVDYPN